MAYQLQILRKIDIANLSKGVPTYLWDEYLRRKKAIDPETNRPRADVVDPRTGYVDNDLPRDEAVTLELMEKTQGFAIAGPNGQVIGRFATFAEADKARAGATVKLDIRVDGIEADADDADDEEAPEGGLGELAFAARRERSLPGLTTSAQIGY